MMQTFIEVFDKKYQRENGKTVTDNYVLSPGLYYIVDLKTGKAKPKIIDKKYEAFADMIYRKLAFYDYNSKLLTMNKPIDSKKIIHSNNYLSFFVKGEQSSEHQDISFFADEGKSKLKQKNIEEYYKILSNPNLKYEKKKEQKLIYKQYEKEFGIVDEEFLQQCKKWINENIFEILTIEKESIKKNYLKIFFVDSEKFSDAEMEKCYVQEGNRYLMPNIFNDAKYNTDINGKTYGMPGANLGFNSKKPFLANHTRRNVVPYLLELSEVIKQKQFFDYLETLCNKGKYYAYIDCEKAEIEGCDWLGLPVGDLFSGIFLQMKKGKEIEIIDMDVVPFISNKIRPFVMKPYLNTDLEKVWTKEERQFVFSKIGVPIDSRTMLAKLIDNTFFNGLIERTRMVSNDELKINGKMKETVIQFRSSLLDWFYKGEEKQFIRAVDKVLASHIRNEVSDYNTGKNEWIQQMIILRANLLDYFKGGMNMSEVKKTKMRFQEVVFDEEMEIRDDETFFYAVGQLLAFFMSYSKSKDVNLDITTKIERKKNVEGIYEELQRLKQKYGYAIKQSDLRNNVQNLQNSYFKHVYAKTMQYEPIEELDKKRRFITIGFIEQNFRWYKKEEKDGAKDE